MKIKNETIISYLIALSVILWIAAFVAWSFTILKAAILVGIFTVGKMITDNPDKDEYYAN